jgi:hypothetical protein
MIVDENKATQENGKLLIPRFEILTSPSKLKPLENRVSGWDNYQKDGSKWGKKDRDGNRRIRRHSGWGIGHPGHLNSSICLNGVSTFLEEDRQLKLKCILIEIFLLLK